MNVERKKRGVNIDTHAKQNGTQKGGTSCRESRYIYSHICPITHHALSWHTNIERESPIDERHVSFSSSTSGREERIIHFPEEYTRISFPRACELLTNPKLSSLRGLLCGVRCDVRDKLLASRDNRHILTLMRSTRS